MKAAHRRNVIRNKLGDALAAIVEARRLGLMEIHRHRRKPKVRAVWSLLEFALFTTARRLSVHLDALDALEKGGPF